MTVNSLILGEFRRSIDDRYRLSIPHELLVAWGNASSDPSGSESMPPNASEKEDEAEPSSESTSFVLAKERPGCLSLWRQADWRTNLDASVSVVTSKLAAGRLGDSLAKVQMFGRLMSCRHKPVRLAGRGRLNIPDGFRQFLDVEPGTEVLVVGAAVCVEIWQLEAWKDCLNEEIPQFTRVLDELSR